MNMNDFYSPLMCEVISKVISKYGKYERRGNIECHLQIPTTFKFGKIINHLHDINLQSIFVMGKKLWLRFEDDGVLGDVLLNDFLHKKRNLVNVGGFEFTLTKRDIEDILISVRLTIEEILKRDVVKILSSKEDKIKKIISIHGESFVENISVDNGIIRPDYIYVNESDITIALRLSYQYEVDEWSLNLLYKPCSRRAIFISATNEDKELSMKISENSRMEILMLVLYNLIYIDDKFLS